MHAITMHTTRMAAVGVALALVQLFVPAPTCADDRLPQPGRVVTPAGTTGQEKFIRYCAVCHGANARGYGALADVLSPKPADLTLISRRNGGKFPFERVTSTIANGGGVKGHGTSAMLAWGPVFSEEASATRAVVRIEQLARYIESLQLPD